MTTIYLMIFFLVIVLCLIILIKKLLPILNVLYGGIPFVRSGDDIVISMIDIANIQKGEKIIDIGCGDGTIMIEIAKRGYAVEGIELNPILVSKCRENIRRNKVEALTGVRVADFWKTDLSQYDVVFIYGISYIMARLERKLLRELKPGARVVSNFFEFPNWPLDKIKGKAKVYWKR
jgi:precorrin-6B methylase 2